MAHPLYRPRRLRESPLIRRMVRETRLGVDNFILPLFAVHGRSVREPIHRLGRNGLLLGACIFAGFGFSLVPDVIAELLNARYDGSVGPDILQVLGKEALKLEREFNRLAGFTPAQDRLPEYMTKEPLPPLGPVFDVPTDDLDNVFNW